MTEEAFNQLESWNEVWYKTVKCCIALQNKPLTLVQLYVYSSPYSLIETEV